MITYEIISKESEENLQLPNEPFEIFGQLIVTRSENEWAYETKLFDQTDFMVFPLKITHLMQSMRRVLRSARI